MSAYQATIRHPSRLASALDGKLVVPEHGRFHEARQAWNLAIDQRPAAVAFPETADDVSAAVLFAREFGLRIAAQGTGHNPGPLGSLNDTVLVKTERMREVRIDPERRIARVGAGVRRTSEAGDYQYGDGRRAIRPDHLKVGAAH